MAGRVVTRTTADEEIKGAGIEHRLHSGMLFFYAFPCGATGYLTWRCRRRFSPPSLYHSVAPAAYMPLISPINRRRTYRRR